MPKAISSILLAGGKSSRMGKDKARLKLDGRLMVLQGIARKLLTISDEVIVVTDGRRYKNLNVVVKWVDDVYPGAGSLVGLYSGLKEASSDYALVVACDMPFLNLEFLRYMIALPRDYDILAPRLGDNIEPLHAIYSQNCLPAIARLLEARNKKVVDLFGKVRVRYLSQEVIERYDPEHRSFFNINSPDELAEARAIIEESQG
ncbi:MAG: molybdenum cofactor guanylyltransferase [Dehalococcoidales bacterium]|nr:molybdenum cofactor guanylyltransferase [Dehalococcoidales bacterium]